MQVPKLIEDAPAPHLSVLLVSPAKYGKTTSLATLPKPLLVGDVDGGISSLFKKKVVPEELLDGIYTTRILSFQDGLEMITTGWKNGPEGKPFASIAFDSFSWFMSNVVKAQILQSTGREKLELQDWGLYLERGLAIARKAHELALREEGCHVVLTAHETDKGGEEGQIGKLGPSIQGQLFDILPGMPDYVFFLRIRNTGAGRPPLPERWFQTAADHRTPAGSRRELEAWEKPDFTQIWGKVKGGGDGG